MAQTNSTGKLTRFGFFAMTASLFITVYEYPTFADYGKTLIFFLLLCGVLWFLPVALCSAELATIKGYQEGGIYSWVGKPLGEKFGFAAIFFQWFQITVGFVTMIYFIIGTLSDILNFPELNKNDWIKFLAVVIIFWLLTLLQFNGTQTTAKLAKYGFSIGIVVPVIILFILAVKYFMEGHPVSTHFTQSHFLPDKKSIGALTSFLLAYMGVEASAPHITDLDKPQKSYPMIMFILVIVGMTLSTIGGSVVSMVLHGDISASSGVVDAFQALISPGKNSVVVIILGLLISFGVIAQVSSWIVSPTEGLQFVSTKGLLPQRFEKVNRAKVPVPLLILQGIVVTFWAALLTFGSHGSGGNVSYQTAISLTVLIYLSAYVLFFVAYFVVIYKKKTLKRDYSVPGGIGGKTIVAGFGLLLSICGIITAFIIPETLTASEGKSYVAMLAVSYVVTLLLPFLFYQFYGKKYTKASKSHHETMKERKE